MEEKIKPEIIIRGATINGGDDGTKTQQYLDWLKTTLKARITFEHCIFVYGDPKNIKKL